MSEKAKLKSLKKRAKAVLQAGGTYKGAEALKITPLALLSFVYDQARPQARTIEHLEKNLPKVNLAKLHVARVLSEERGHKRPKKTSSKKKKPKATNLAKVTKLAKKPKAATKPKAKKVEKKALKSKAKAKKISSSKPRTPRKPKGKAQAPATTAIAQETSSPTTAAAE